MSGAVVIFVHKIVDGQVVSTIKEEKNENCSTQITRSLIKSESFDFNDYAEDKLCLRLNPLFNNKELLLITKESIIGSTATLLGKLNFPTLIKCQNCETNFPTKYQYQRHQCDFNVDKMEDDEMYECSLCYKMFANKSDLERHQQTIHKGNECEYCGKRFVSDNRLRIHKENHCKKAGDISKFYRSDVTVWKCKKCHEVFSSMQNGNHHVACCSQDNDSIETISTEILLQCEFCNRTYSDKNLLLMHQRNHTTTKNYECVNCSRTFDSYQSASSHWMKKCSEFTNLFYLPKLSFCEYCDRTFKSHEILYNHKIKKKHYTPKLHIAINVEGNPKKSAMDNKDTINQLIQDVLETLEVPMTALKEFNLNRNKNDIKKEPDDGENKSSSFNIQPDEDDVHDMVVNTVNKRRKFYPKHPARNKKLCVSTDEGFKYQCERCIKVFTSIVSLDAHRSNEHVATFCCEECGQTLPSAKALLIHCRAHKSLKPYVCDTCGRSYSQTSHLWQHMRFHQGIKPFACPHEGCEARYTIRPDLKDHIRKVHTRERPFKCNVCNKCFLTGSVYYQHRLIHTNDRRYGCEICQKRFFRADALNNHKRIHTDERPYPCTMCGREFRQKGDRNKHVRTQHPEHFNSNT